MQFGPRCTVVARLTLHMMIDTEDLNSPKAFTVFLIHPSSNKQYSVAATCLSTSTGAHMLVTFFSINGRSSANSFKKFSLRILKLSFYSSGTTSSMKLSHQMRVLPGLTQNCLCLLCLLPILRVFLEDANVCANLCVLRQQNVLWRLIKRYAEQLKTSCTKGPQVLQPFCRQGTPSSLCLLT